MYCEAVSSEGLPYEPYEFKVAYDKLVIAVGAQPMTFNIQGVEKYATFLREVYHAQKIRRKLLLNLMLSEQPGICMLIVKKVSVDSYPNKLHPSHYHLYDLYHLIQKYFTKLQKVHTVYEFLNFRRK